MRCLAAVACLFAVSGVRGDEVVLASGGSLWGEVAESADGYLLRMAHGEIRLSRAEVSRVVPEETPAAVYAHRAADLGCREGELAQGHGAEPHLELARFCIARGMSAEARREYEMALRHDPEQPEALRAIETGVPWGEAQDPDERDAHVDEDEEAADEDVSDGSDETPRTEPGALVQELVRLREEVGEQRRESRDRELRDLLRQRRRVLVYGPGYALPGVVVGPGYVGPYFIGRDVSGDTLVSPWPASLPGGLYSYGRCETTGTGLGLRLRYRNTWRGGSFTIDSGW